MSEFQIGPETFVTLRFQVFDAEGEAATEAEVLGTVFGTGQLLIAVERAIEGKSAGNTVELTVPPEEAFGLRDPSRIVAVAREEFPSDAAAGDRFEVENEQGGVLVVHVLEVTEESVLFDTNHPLADQETRFVVEILEVRPASDAEIEAAEALMEEDQAYLSAGTPQVSISQMIRPSN